MNDRGNQGFAVWKTIAVVVCLLCVGTATYAVSSLQITHVSPEPETWLNKHQVSIGAGFDGVIGSAVIYVDGKALPTEKKSESRELTATADLADGPHEIEVRASRALGIGEVVRSWKINVDSKPPPISLSTPAPNTIVKDKLLEIVGRTKPGTRLTVRVTGKNHKYEVPAFTAEANGSFKALVGVTDDKNRIRIDALDRAGNKNALGRDIVCDLVAPSITDIYPAPDAVIKLDPTVTIKASVSESGSGVTRAVLTVDGVDHEFDVPPTGGDIVFKAEELPEGTREVALEVQDKAGWKARKEWKFLVNTTEMFGTRPMTRGALGHDVAVLQKRLIKFGDLEAGHVTSVYDDETVKAVQQFQAEHNLDVDGTLGVKTVALMSPRLDVDLSTFTLTLYDADEKVKSYGIACGMPQFPTPRGKFHVMYLERNPTWIPPKDSVWAREAKVTPPGPGNPLGTRWIGLDSNAVGIHGTPSEWSIGSAASHGCLRMRIADVEDLFERVNPGTEVTIH